MAATPRLTDLVMLLKGERTPVVRDMGGFVTHLNMPGWLLPRPRDHGHGALAMVVESILAPGRHIAMHEHRNDEIISWVPNGIMRHDDKATGPLVTDRDHLMVMNAGRSFWHSEETLSTDPPLRMLQILVRPYRTELEPGIQHGPVPAAARNGWRHLVGPENGEAPFFVRNTLDLFDINAQAGATLSFPAKKGLDLYFYVFSGLIQVGAAIFGEGDQGLALNGGELPFEAKQDSQLVAFLIDPLATVARQGTVGDHPKIPPAAFARPLLALLRWKRAWANRFRRTT